MPNMTDVLGSNTPLEILIPYFIPSTHIREPNCIIMLTVVLKMHFTTFSFRKFCINTPFTQIGKQNWWFQRFHFHTLKTRLCRRLLLKRKGNGTNMRSLFLNLTQKVRYTFGTIQYRSQGKYITSLTQPEIIPFIDFGIHLKRCVCFLSKWWFIPKVHSLSFDWIIPQTMQIIFQFNILCFFYCHFLMNLNVNEMCWFVERRTYLTEKQQNDTSTSTQQRPMRKRNNYLSFQQHI